MGIGGTSFRQYAVVTHHGEPLCSLTTIIIAVDDGLRKPLKLPKADIMKAAMVSQQPRVDGIKKLKWPVWAYPGGGAEHKVDLERSIRPENPFCMQATVRQVERDEFGHMSQSQYALLHEEARACAGRNGAYGDFNDVAIGPPVSLQMDFVGQALPGDVVYVYTWWDGEAVSTEMERRGTNDK